MKLLYLIIFLLVVVNAWSQKIKGVYKTAADLKLSTIQFQSTRDMSYKIKIYNGPFRNYVKVKTTDTSYVLLKDSLFGYCDAWNNCYRFFGDEIYTILNPKEEILLYKIEYGMDGPKSFLRSTRYFFSINAAAAIQKLDLYLVLKAFEGNDQFTELIELYFRNNSELLEYDPVHKMYKLNRLFELSMQLKK